MQIIRSAIILFCIMANLGMICAQSSPCDEKNGGCAQICTPENGQAVCSCRDGYVTSVENTTKCVQCINSRADIAMAFDASGSIKWSGAQNWDILKAFVMAIIDGLPIAEDKVHMSVIVFSSNVTVQFYLNRSYDKDVLSRLANESHYEGKKTDIAAALRLMRTDVFVPGRGDRPDAVNFGILLTDGQSTSDPGETQKAAKEIKDTGVSMFTIGVTNDVNDVELKSVASKPAKDYYRQVETFDELKSLLAIILNRVCELKSTAPTSTTTTTTPLPTTTRTTKRSTAPQTTTTTTPTTTTIATSTVNARQTTPPTTKTVQTTPQATTQTTTSTAAPTTTIQSCTDGRADIAIAIDASGSIEWKGKGNFNLVLEFVDKLLEKLAISEDMIHVALLMFSSDVEIRYRLDTSYDKIRLSALTFQSNYSGGETNISGAIDVMRTQIFNGRNGDRDDVINIGVVMTDGESTDNGKRTARQSAKEAKQAGIKLITIGVTNDINPYELADIASNPKQDHTFRALTFADLEPMLNGLLFRVCGAPVITPSMTPSTEQSTVTPAKTSPTLKTGASQSLTDDRMFLISLIVGSVTAFCALLAIIVAAALVSKARKDKKKPGDDESVYSEINLPSNMSLASGSYRCEK